MAEKTIQTQIMLAMPQAGATVFRNNTGVALAISAGKAWHKVVQECIKFVRRMGFTAAPIKYGLTEGSSDLIGWKTITVTPEMVGKRVAIFLALEVKTSTGKLTPEQENFIQAVLKGGGMAGVVRSADEAIGICNPLLGWGGGRI